MNKIYKTVLVALSLIFFPLTSALTQDITQPPAEAMENVMIVEDGAIVTAIENRSPQGTARTFSANS